MINFIDEKGVKHSAIVECKKTKGVNGEKSLSGTIYTNDKILEGIGRGWRLEFENEKYCLTYVYPIDEGNRIVVEFDAVHEFFFDLNKKVVYSELNGSNTAKAYLDLIFNGSGYSYVIEVNIPAFEKEGFGMRNRLDLFKEFVSDTGVEFSVNGKIVRILEKVGSNLSTIVKKGFNLNELRIEKDPSSFITYKKGFGAWVDEDDHSKGRLEVEYLSPLASIYGKLEGDPIVDERYKIASNFETRLKNDVESSYGISVDIDMEDLTKAGYEYEQPHEGDYIMAINKDLGFEQKIRIMSYETSYDTNGNIIDHKVSCGSDNIIRKSIKEDDDFRKEIQAGLEGAISTSNKAWISANGKTAVFEGPDEPTATAIGDMWFQIDGDKKIMRIWNGYEWKPVFNPGVIEETIKDLDAELEQTTTTANGAVSKAEQAIRDIGFANSAIEASDGKISSLEQNLDGFQQVVQNTYADKTTVTALAAQWTQTTELANGHTSQISSLGNDLNFRVKSDEIITQINLSPENILISGKRITIDGNTYITNGVIKTAHIADLAVSGAKIADASITSAKIISLDAAKITATSLSAITTNTGALNVSGWLTTTTENYGFRGTYNYGDELYGAYNPRWFDGDYRLSHRYLTFQANVYDVNSNNTRGAFKYYGETFYGADYLKLRQYTSSTNKTIRARVDVTADSIIIGPNFNGAQSIILNSNATSFFAKDASFADGITVNSQNQDGVRTGRINAPMNYNTLILNNNRNLGTLELGYDTSRYLRAKDVYDRTYSLASNMIVTNEGTLGRATSARKYKTNIVELKEIYSKAKDVLQIQSVTWLDKRALVETGTEQRGYGFIADDFHELGLKEVVQYGTDGQVEGLAYDRISMYHNVILQDHEQQLKRLDSIDSNVIKLVANNSAYGTRLNNLESEVFRLKKRIEELEKIA